MAAKKTMIYKGKRWTRIATRISFTGAQNVIDKVDWEHNLYRITGRDGEYHIWEYKPIRSYPRINVGSARSKAYVHTLKKLSPHKKKSKHGREGRYHAHDLYDYPR